MKHHRISVDEAYHHLGSGAEGLSSNEVLSRQKQYGLNEIPEKKRVGPWQIFGRQFLDFMIVILILAAIISGYLGDMADTLIILFIVLVNAIIGFYQEYKAEKAMEAIKKLSAMEATVMRDGDKHLIKAVELVPGDIVYLETGNSIPADIRITESFNAKMDESSLTGESVSVEKTAEVIMDEEIPLGDMHNLAFKGTVITNGRATGVVTHTGQNTELGKIAQLLQNEKSRTPLQLRMTDFSKKLSYIILAICLVLFLSGWLRGEDPMRMLLLSISLAVAAIPEALPALITIALAKGAASLVRQKALIRKLPAVETLGSVDFICSDKTGTLTENKMTVTEIYTLPEKGKKDKTDTGYETLYTLMALNNDVVLIDGKIAGDPTELALIHYVDKIKGKNYHDTKKKTNDRKGEIAFDSDRKCMTTIHEWDSKYLVITKGAVEIVSQLLADKSNNDQILEKASSWASDGLRVLAFGYKEIDVLPDHPESSTIEKELIFGGLTAMIDPPRKEAILAIEACTSAGIKTVMITGDHPSTAMTIAKKIGLWHEDSLAVTGIELDKMSEREFLDKVEKISVYARVSPAQKLKIVKALQDKNHFISMTGDGVNDAPALKAANIGVAMGITGTDVSRAAADLILLDDNFATIVKAVKEGRRIFDNIRKFVKYIMTCNGAEIWTIVLAPLIGLPMPLLPIHILYINLVTDGLPGIALANEKAEQDIMKKPPRKSNESLFSHGIGMHIVWVGLLMAGITLGTQAWAIGKGLGHWQTMVFTVLAFSQLGHVMAIRSDRSFLFSFGIFSNLPLIGAVLLTFILQLIIIYLPAANDLLKTQPLSFIELLICIGASSIVFHAVELEKWIVSRRVKNQINTT